MIEGTEMAKNGAFDRIYASSFYFNDRGLVKWPAHTELKHLSLLVEMDLIEVL